MKAVIMAGGIGSRLKPLTNDIPKPMVPIIDKPVMQYIIEHLRDHNYKDIAVTLCYKPEVIMDYFGDGSRYGVNLRYFIERQPLGTAGSVKNAAEFLDEDFIIMSGDSFTDIDLGEFRNFHYESGGLFTMAIKYHKDCTGFGAVGCDEYGKVMSFIEKPKEKMSGFVNTGIYFLNREVLDMIPDGFYDFAKNLMPRLKDNLYAFKTDGYWSDIGTLVSYYDTNLMVANRLTMAGFA